MADWKQSVMITIIVLAVIALLYVMYMYSKKGSNGENMAENEIADDVTDEDDMYDYMSDGMSDDEANVTVNDMMLKDKPAFRSSKPCDLDDVNYANVKPYGYNIESMGCPIADTEKKVKKYYKKLYGLREMTEKERADKALCDHTDFRYKTDQSSSQMGMDSVDKVNMLYLSENDTDARRHEGKTIQEVYDGLTKDKNLVLRNNTRMPDFPNTCNTVNDKNNVVKGYKNMNSEPSPF